MFNNECDLSLKDIIHKKERKALDLLGLSHSFFFITYCFLIVLYPLLKVSVTVRGVGMFMRLFEKSYKM